MQVLCNFNTFLLVFLLFRASHYAWCKLPACPFLLSLYSITAVLLPNRNKQQEHSRVQQEGKISYLLRLLHISEIYIMVKMTLTELPQYIHCHSYLTEILRQCQKGRNKVGTTRIALHMKNSNLVIKTVVNKHDFIEFFLKIQPPMVLIVFFLWFRNAQ